MELDDLKAAWMELAQRVEAVETQRSDNRRRRARGATRRVLLRLTAGQAFQSLIWIAVVAVVAPFWIAHRHVPHLLVAGLALHLYGVATICVSVLQMVVIGRTYCTAPVVLYQGRLAELQRLRVVSTLALGLPWWILWIPATMVGGVRFAGVDVYAASPAWIYVALAIGVAAMALTVWAARRLFDRPVRSFRLQRIVDNLSGCGLARAMQQIDDVARFARE